MRLAKSGGIDRIDGDASSEIVAKSELIIKKLAKESAGIAQSKKRKTVKKEDVEEAYKLCG